MIKDAPKRSLTKAVLWRVMDTFDTIFLSFLITVHLNTALSIGITEAVSKILLYFQNERVWAASVGAGN